jgi:hypothetical protein
LPRITRSCGKASHLLHAELARIFHREFYGTYSLSSLRRRDNRLLAQRWPIDLLAHWLACIDLIHVRLYLGFIRYFDVSLRLRIVSQIETFNDIKTKIDFVEREPRRLSGAAALIVSAQR